MLRTIINKDVENKQAERRLEGLVCIQCGDTMTEIEKETVQTLTIILAQIMYHEVIYFYLCLPKLQSFSKEDVEAPVTKAPTEKNIFLGSFATQEAIVHIMSLKFPLY